MPISGTDPALTEARLGMLRLGGSRLGYVLPIVYATINGVDRTSDVRIAGASIRDILNGTPNTATFRVDGTAPTEGHEVILNFGVSGPTQFKGRILATAKVYEGKPANVAWDCQCISPEWLLNRRKVTKRYLSTSATAIILDIIASYTSGFTTDVQAGLPSLDEITFTSEDVTDCLDRICQRIGEDWQLDYDNVLHVPASDGVTANAITDSEDHGMRDIHVTTDLSQVRTRQSGEGGGSNASVEVAAGATSIALDDATWYALLGGTVKSGPQIITYTGKSTLDGTGTTVAGVPLSPSAPSAAMIANTPGQLSAGAYQYATAFDTPAGRSEISALSSAASITSVSAPSAPSGAVVTNTPGNLRTGNYGYKLTNDTAAGQTTLSGSGSVSVTDVSAPSLGSAAAAGTTGGALTPSQAYAWYFTYITAIGETTISGSLSFTLGASDTAVNLTNIPVSSDGRVIGRRIYREVPPGGATNIQLVGEIRDNTKTAWTDTVGDAAVGGGDPATNTSGSGQITVTIPTSSDGRVTKRTLWRTFTGGSVYYKLATIGNNTDTTYVDNVPDTSLGDLAPTINTSGTGQMSVTSIPVGPAGTTARVLFRTEADGSVPKFLATVPGNVTTTFTDNIADTRLGEQAPSASAVGGTAGATTLRVKDTAVVDAAGGWAQAGNQLIRFTGRSVASGEGNLTGIPASGVGSMAAAIASGVAVINHPHLTGVSGILYAIPQGESVNVWVTRNDTAAQTFMAAAVGWDGIHEADPIQDRRMSETEITARCDAKLEELSTPLVTVRYETRDSTTKSGREVTITLAAPNSISGTFLIQSVTTTGFSSTGAYRPLRQVECSSRRLTFEQVLRVRRAQVS